MRDLHLAAILLGIVADKLAAAASIGLLLYLLGAESPVFQLAALVAGASCTVLGGFVSARYAARRFLAHGGAVGIAGLAFSVGRFASTPPGSSAGHAISWEIAAWTSVVAAGFVGGSIASRISPRGGDFDDVQAAS